MYFAFSIFKILIDEFMLYSFKIVRNYSQALFSVAKSLSDAKKILEQISIFTSIFHESALVKKAICSPIIDMSIKGNLIDLVAKKCKFAKTSKQFLHILIKNKRLTLLPEIVNDLKIIIMESEGIKATYLSSAYEMSKKELTSIESFLKQKLNTKIALSHDVDPSLIGGVIIKYDSNLIDCSISGALNRVKDLATKTKM